jgi:hypothetical protein
MPFGSLAFMLGILIQNLIHTAAIKTLTLIKNINQNVENFKVYCFMNNNNVFYDYSFICELPTILKKNLPSFKIKERKLMIKKVSQLFDFILKSDLKEAEKRYFLYYVFYSITSLSELETIYNHFQLKINDKQEKITTSKYEN